MVSRCLSACKGVSHTAPGLCLLATMWYGPGFHDREGRRTSEGSVPTASQEAFRELHSHIFWCSRSRVRPKDTHLWQAPRWCWRCRPRTTPWGLLGRVIISILCRRSWKLRLTEGEDSVLSLSPQTPVFSLFLTQWEMECSVQIHSAKEKRQESNGGPREPPLPICLHYPVRTDRGPAHLPVFDPSSAPVTIRKHLLHFPPSFWQQPPPPAIHVASVT